MSRCPECRREFKVGREGQAWCSKECNRVAGNRELARARVLYRALYHWRYNRKSAKMNLSFICREISHWIQEDRLAQRLPPPPHRHDGDRGHQRKGG